MDYRQFVPWPDADIFEFQDICVGVKFEEFVIGSDGVSSQVVHLISVNLTSRFLLPQSILEEKKIT